MIERTVPNKLRRANSDPKTIWITAKTIRTIAQNGASLTRRSRICSGNGGSF